ncbi:MAG: hypothetical protein ACE145_18885 [Terriglobia bacterium]
MPEQLVVGGQVVGRRVDSREGEICLVCGKAISSQDATYLVNGQRVPLHLTPCFEIFGVNPAKYLIKLRPRGAFLDASAAGLELSTIWLYFGSYVLLGLIFGALAAHRAFHVGRSPMRWLGIGFVANLPGFLVLSALPRLEADTAAGVPAGLTKIAATYSPIACPACGAENHPSAHECSACGNQLAPRVVSEVQRAGLRNG